MIVLKDPTQLKHVQIQREVLGLTRKQRRHLCRRLKRQFKWDVAQVWFAGDQLAIQTNIKTAWTTPAQCLDRNDRINQLARELFTAIGQEVKNFQTIDEARHHPHLHDPWESALPLPTV
jgi:hypothetical protein